MVKVSIEQTNTKRGTNLWGLQGVDLHVCSDNLVAGHICVLFSSQCWVKLTNNFSSNAIFYVQAGFTDNENKKERKTKEFKDGDQVVMFKTFSSFQDAR